MTLPTNGPWTVPVEGFQVYALQLSCVLVDIRAQGDDGAPLTIRLPGEVDFSVAGGSTQRLGPADSAGWSDFAALFVLRGAQLSCADATDYETQLHIAFVDGHTLRAGPTRTPRTGRSLAPGSTSLRCLADAWRISAARSSKVADRSDQPTAGLPLGANRRRVCCGSGSVVVSARSPG
jgi:hypothetical protein